MYSVNTILSQLTPFKNKRDILVHEQDVSDIITGILVTHEKYKSEYDKIVDYFIGNTPIATARNVWEFVRETVPYKVEPEHEQLLKSPAAILSKSAIGGRRNTSDCKNMSLFIGGILDAANRKGQKINWCYRFSSYKFLDKVPQHVFCVLNPDTNKEIWCDAVLPTFNNRKQYYYKLDKQVKNMALVQLSGIGKTGKQKRQEFFQKLKQQVKKAGKIVVKYNPASVASRNAFIVLVTLNSRSLATNLKKLIDKGNNDIFNIWAKVGGNKDSLSKAIESGAKKKRLGAIPMPVRKGIINPRASTATDAAYTPAMPVRYANSMVPDTSNIYDDPTGQEPELEQDFTEVDNEIIGDPVTAAAAIAAAAPIVAMVINLFKKNSNIISAKDGEDLLKDSNAAVDADALETAAAIDKEAAGVETTKGNQIIKGGTKAPAGSAGGKLPILPIGAAAVALYFITKKR